MPIQLDVAFDPGDMDPGKSYTHVEVTQIQFDRFRKKVGFSVSRGYLESGEFVVGSAAPRQSFTIGDVEGGTEYTDFMGAAASGTLEETVAVGLYNWLLAKDIFEGSII